MNEFKIGQVLYFRASKAFRAAHNSKVEVGPRGYYPVELKLDEFYLDVKWLDHATKNGQVDGGYMPRDFSVTPWPPAAVQKVLDASRMTNVEKLHLIRKLVEEVVEVLLEEGR